jgi:PAS domain-containing protein
MMRMGWWTAAVAAFAVAVAIAGYAYYRHDSAQIHQQRYQAIAAIGTLKAEQLHLWRQVQIDHAESLSRAPTLAEGLAASGPTADTLINRARRVLASSVETYGYAAGYLLTAKGQVVLAVGPRVGEPAPGDLPTVGAATLTTKPVMGTFFRGVDGRVYIDTAGAVRNPQGLVIGVVVLRADAEKPLFSMLQSWPVPSPSAETLLVRRDGDEVVFMNDLRHRAGGALTVREPITRTESPSVKAVLGTEGPYEGRDYRGVVVLADLQPVANSDWFLVAKVDADEVWAEARYRAGVAGALATLLILVSAVGAALFYRQRQAAEFRGLYESLRENDQLLREAEAVGHLGSFVYDIPADAWKSSVNLDQVMGIGGEHPRNVAGWLQVVHPIDRREMEAYLREVLANRRQFDRQYRIQRPSDHEERWVHGRARVDYAPNGTPLRMVGSIQDVTDDRAAELARQAEDERYQRQRNALIQLASNAPPTDDASMASAYQQLTEVAARTLGVDRVSLWRYTEGRAGIRCLELYERDANRHSSGTELSAADNPPYFHALTEADVLAADDAHRDPRTSQFSVAYLAPLGISSMMDAVIRLRGSVIGVLCCEHTGRMRRWTHDEQTFAVAIANLVALLLAGRGPES